MAAEQAEHAAQGEEEGAAPEEVAVMASLTVKKSIAIIGKLESLDELPDSMRKMLGHLRQGLAAKGRRHIDRVSGTVILGKALKSAEKALQDAHEEAQAANTGAEAEKAARAAVALEAEAAVVVLSQAVRDAKAYVGTAGKALGARLEDFKAAKAAHKSAEAKVKVVEQRKQELQSAEQEDYEPMKLAPAGGAEGQKHLSTLSKAGKAYGFHKDLVDVMPAVLRKQPANRRTFDGLVLQQVEVEFARGIGSLDVAVKEGELAAVERACEAQAAQERVALAREEQLRAGKVAADAEASLTAARRSLLEARRLLRGFPAEARRRAKAVGIAEARLAKFLAGPVAAYAKALTPGAARAAAAPGGGASTRRQRRTTAAAPAGCGKFGASLSRQWRRQRAASVPASATNCGASAQEPSE